MTSYGLYSFYDSSMVSRARVHFYGPKTGFADVSDHRQPPKMDGCPFWASVALATLTTKQLKTHVAAVKAKTHVSEYITHVREDVLKFY
jgi:hypothetical protein